MTLIEGALTQLPEGMRRTLRGYLADVGRLFGQEVEAVLLYGRAARGEHLPGRSNINILVILKDLKVEHLRRYAAVHRRWKNDGIVVPLFLAIGELSASAGRFPLEWLDIQESHILLAGRDPLVELKVDNGRLRQACEQEISGNLLRLRQRFVEGDADGEAVVLLVSLSLTALLPCLRGLLRLSGRPAPKSSEDLLRALQPAMGIDGSVLLEALSLKRGLITPGAQEIPRLFERYLGGLQTLLERIERLKAEGRL